MIRGAQTFATIILLLSWAGSRTAATATVTAPSGGDGGGHGMASAPGALAADLQAESDQLQATGGPTTDWLGNVWIRAGSPDDVGGAGEANWYIDWLAKGDASMVQLAVDRYHLNAPPGASLRWGRGWLAKHVVAVLLMRAYELRQQLSAALLDEIDRLAVDALDETTFRIDGCGVTGNSCAEDFGSMLAVVAIARSLYPAAVAALGDEELERLERKYFSLTFTTRNRSFGLVRETSLIDGQEYAMVQNHSGQSAVYSAIVLTELGNALQAHLAAGRRIPSFYLDDPDLVANLRSMMAWIQTTALPDGSAFVEGCRHYGTGQVAACNDPLFADTVPTFLPAGRAVALLLGEAALGPGYRFLEFAPHEGGNSGNAGRTYLYSTLNPGPVDAGLQASVADGVLRVAWSNPDALTFDVWGPSGRVGTTTGAAFEVDLGGASGRLLVGLVPRTPSRLVAGFQLARAECFVPRRHLVR